MATQLDMLQAAFDRGERLTVAESMQKYGIYALSQRCGELKRERSYPVDSVMIETVTGKRVAQYFKAPEIIRFVDGSRLVDGVLHPPSFE